MIVQEAYRTQRTVSVCHTHYEHPPMHAPPLGPVQDAQDTRCQFCVAPGDYVTGPQVEGRVLETADGRARVRWPGGVEEWHDMSDLRPVGPAAPRLSVDDRVEGGQPGTEDYDTGRVLDIEGDKADVGWDSGVRTWTPIEDLTAL